MMQKKDNAIQDVRCKFLCFLVVGGEGVKEVHNKQS